MGKDQHFVSLPVFAGYVLATGALAWLAGAGWVPLIAGAAAVAVNERFAKRRPRPGKGPEAV